MTNETLRMQMLSGVITESEYKAKLEEIGMFHDPVGYKKSELSDLDKMFTKEYKGDGVYVIYKNGEEVKTIEGEGNANAWINDEKKKIEETSFDDLEEGIYDLTSFHKGSHSTGRPDFDEMTADEIEDYLEKDKDNPGGLYGRSLSIVKYILDKKRKEENKESLNENFVGMGMVGNIFDREKTDYELAFEHFTKGSLSENETEVNEYDDFDTESSSAFFSHLANKLKTFLKNEINLSDLEIDGVKIPEEETLEDAVNGMMEVLGVVMKGKAYTIGEKDVAPGYLDRFK